MLNWIVNRQLDSLERRLGTSVDYLRHLTRTSKSAFFKRMGFVPMAAHHGGTPRRRLFAARFLATHREDCGTCVQIVVNQAIRERVSVEIIQALTDDDPSGLDQETRRVVEFTRAVLDNTDDQEHLREELRASEPAVLCEMPAAVVYFLDPDGNQLEFLAMLPEEPRPELGIVNWTRWKTRAVAHVPSAIDCGENGGST